MQYILIGNSGYEPEVLGVYDTEAQAISERQAIHNNGYFGEIKILTNN